MPKVVQKCTNIIILIKGKKNFLSLIRRMLKKNNSKSSKPTHQPWLGVIHGDQMPFILGIPLVSNKNFSSSERTFSKTLISYWSSFIKYDDPNYDNNNEMWPIFKTTNKKDNDTLRAYINLRSPKPEKGSDLRNEYCKFWNSYIRDLVIKENTTSKKF